jgi:hypothetical protein
MHTVDNPGGGANFYYFSWGVGILFGLNLKGVIYFGFYFYCNFINKLFEMFAVGGGEGGGRGGGFVIHPCVHLLSLT